MMRSSKWLGLALCVACSAHNGVGQAAEGATPSAAQALNLTPIQQGVDFTKPSAEEAARCTISAKQVGKNVGWVVTDANGTTLRKFVDNNGDNIVDQWSYFRDGLEVYRDIDANYNGKADQYRWFHTSGTRWGIDLNEDGTIDSWKRISAEEVTAELIAALAQRDVARFECLLLSEKELAGLGLSKDVEEILAKKTTDAPRQFETLAKSQTAIGPKSKWLQFSGNRPGVVPAGTNGSTQDLSVYENVVAIAETDGQHGEIIVGTLVRVGDAWRLVDAPLDGAVSQATAGVFFHGPAATRPSTSGNSAEDGQKLLADLEKLDQVAAQATTPEQIATYNAQRADLLEKIAGQAATPQEREMWLRQLADMINAAVQSGGYPNGGERLQALFEELQKNEADKDIAAYFKFQQLTANYALSLQSAKPDFAKIQTQWLADLEQYAADYPDSPNSAEAMLQLGIAKEFAGEEKEASDWYGRVVSSFPQSPAAQTAAGAQTRVNSVGKVIKLTGKTTKGQTLDLARYRGRVVLIQYWATWSDRARADIPAIKELVAKHGKTLSVIGVSLDARAQDLSAYLAANRIPWPQIFEEGGMNSRPANQLGILSLPTMILVDQTGKVVNRNIQTAELEREVGKLIR